MALTNFAALTAEQKIVWSRDVWQDARDKMIIDMVEFGSPAEASGLDFDWEIKSIVQDADRPMKEWVFVPALLLLLAMAMNQKRRARRENLSA